MDQEQKRFHYTDIHGLLGILESQTLRMCSHRTMNDSMELKWSIEQKLSFIEHDCKTEVQHELLREVRKCIGSLPLNSYMTCFSSESDLLSQWRAYGDDGKGVAIGFSLAKDKNLPTSTFPVVSDLEQSYFGFFDVQYGTELEESILPFECYIRVFNDYIESYTKHPSKKEYYVNTMSELLLKSSMFSKNPAFQEEKESRILRLIFRDKDIDLPKIKFKVTGKKLTSYLEYEFNKSTVSEIMLGPKSEIDKNELNLFLQKHGYEDIIISRSSASYR